MPVFSQLISFLPDREFRRCVERYRGDIRLRGFSCWDQYLAIAFAQLTYRESLRDIEACLRSIQGKLYHLIPVYHIRMIVTILATIAAKLPSSVKYRMAKLKPLYTRAMRLGQPSTIVETSVGQLRWRIDALTSQEFLRGTYEPYMQDAFLKYVLPGNTVFDIGAHAGFHSVLCGLLVGATGRVFAFEPNPISRCSLEGQIRLNPTLRLEVVPYALSDTVGLADFDATQGSQSRITSTGKSKVEMRTLDSLVSVELPIPDVIKIDVEGEEEKVLRGARKTLSKFRPIVLCDYNDDQTLASLSRILLPLAYEVLPGPPVIGIPR